MTLHPFRTELIDDEAQLARHRQAWAALAAGAAEANILYGPELGLAAWRHLLGGKGLEWLLVWRRDEALGGEVLAGLFPLTRTRTTAGMPASSIRLWHHDQAFLSTPLILREHVDAVCELFAGWFVHDSGAACLSMRLARADGPVFGALEREFARAGLASRRFDEHQRACLRGAVDGEVYLRESLSRKRAKNLRNTRARLVELGTLTIGFDLSVEDISTAVQGFMELEQAGWKGRRGTALGVRPETRKFLVEAANKLALRGAVRVACLRLDDEVLAIAIIFVENGEAWLWKIAYDENYARYSPGVLMLHDLTGLFLAEDDIRSVDSCATANHPMIDHIWRERQPMTDLLVVAPSAPVPARAVFASEWLRRCMRGAAKRVVAGLRR